MARPEKIRLGEILVKQNLLTDEQVRGPFRSFRHIHEFEATPGGSIMTARI